MPWRQKPTQAWTGPLQSQLVSLEERSLGWGREVFSWRRQAGRDLGHELVQLCVLCRNLPYSFSISFACSSDMELLTRQSSPDYCPLSLVLSLVFPNLSLGHQSDFARSQMPSRCTLAQRHSVASLCLPGKCKVLNKACEFLCEVGPALLSTFICRGPLSILLSAMPSDFQLLLCVNISQ